VPNDGDGFKPPINPTLPNVTDMQRLVIKKVPGGCWPNDNDGDWTNIVSGGSSVS